MGVRLVAIVKENIEEEISEFREQFWPEADLFVDENKVFYKGLFGGQLAKTNILELMVKVVCCNKTLSDNNSTAKAGGYKGNLKGEGLIRGGLYVIDKGGRVEFAFTEDEMGDHASVEDVLFAAGRCGGLSASGVGLEAEKKPRAKKKKKASMFSCLTWGKVA
mmetsp:Transcript_100510/g.181395  ORF Transcript_100510/g.181395 Transcript_100510/m.181395 type:complete len:163 (-) Transcript_100510:34-522(-)